MMRNRELMIYRGFPDHRDGLLHRMALLMDAFEMGEGHSRERFYGCIHSLLELAGNRSEERRVGKELDAPV